MADHQCASSLALRDVASPPEKTAEGEPKKEDTKADEEHVEELAQKFSLSQRGLSVLIPLSSTATSLSPWP